MSAIAVGWAFKVQEARSARGDPLPSTAHHVLLAIADRWNNQAEAAWPSYADICARTGLSERGVRNAVQLLEKERLVAREPRLSSHGRKVGIIYRLPKFDTELAIERASYDFPLGKHDPEVAQENEADVGGWFEGMLR